MGRRDGVFDFGEDKSNAGGTEGGAEGVDFCVCIRGFIMEGSSRRRRRRTIGAIRTMEVMVEEMIEGTIEGMMEGAKVSVRL